MAEINDGGPAFPVPMVKYEGEMFFNVECTGASLRDWFASQATENDIEHHSLGELRSDGRTYNRKTREQAKYSYADAMIKARGV